MDPETSFAERIAQIDAAIQERDFQTSFEQCRQLLKFPGKFDSAGEFELVLQRLAAASQLHEDWNIPERAKAAAENPGDVEAVYHLGYALYEIECDGMAATILKRAYELLPDDDDVVTMYVMTLDLSGLRREAVQVLQAIPKEMLERVFFLRYLLARCALLGGMLTLARQAGPNLRPSDEGEEFQAAQIERALARADLMVSDGEEPADLDRRRWYYITHGTILLDQWVDGPENMGGRNWLTTLDERAFKESLLRLQSVLRVWDWTAPRIWSLPERNDQVLAIAAGRMFDWPVEPWPEHGSTEPGLIVAYTLPNHTADMLNALVEHQPGQLLWCCAINWLDQFPVAAGICSLLAISAFPFWEPFMPFAARPEDGYRKLDATEETPSELADRILATPVDPFSIEDLDALEAVALRVRDVTGLGAGPHRRPPGQDREDQPLDTMPPCEML